MPDETNDRPSGDRPRVAQFRDAFRGIGQAWVTERNMPLHAGATALVVALGVWQGVSLVEWCLLTLCIAIVIAAELFNTAIEYLARAITDQHDERIKQALDISSGAVLVTAIGAAVVGAIVILV